LPARAILARLHVAQANVAYVAGCSQGNVSNMLANRAPLSQAVKDAIVLLVDGAATRDELFKVES
jgi:trans-aconitate methyltransferase